MKRQQGGASVRPCYLYLSWLNCQQKKKLNLSLSFLSLLRFTLYQSYETNNRWAYKCWQMAHKDVLTQSLFPFESKWKKSSKKKTKEHSFK